MALCTRISFYFVPGFPSSQYCIFGCTINIPSPELSETQLNKHIKFRIGKNPYTTSPDSQTPDIVFGIQGPNPHASLIRQTRDISSDYNSYMSYLSIWGSEWSTPSNHSIEENRVLNNYNNGQHLVIWRTTTYIQLRNKKFLEKGSIFSLGVGKPEERN